MPRIYLATKPPRTRPSAKLNGSVYFSVPVREALAPIGDNLSGRIAAIARRYTAIVNRSMPVLAEDEWFAIIDAAGKSVLFRDALAGPSMLWQIVVDARATLQQDWGVDVVSLAARLREMPYHQLAAIAEVVHRFRCSGKLGADPSDLLRETGARIAGPAQARTTS